MIAIFCIVAFLLVPFQESGSLTYINYHCLLLLNDGFNFLSCQERDFVFFNTINWFSKKWIWAKYDDDDKNLQFPFPKCIKWCDVAAVNARQKYFQLILPGCWSESYWQLWIYEDFMISATQNDNDLSSTRFIVLRLRKVGNLEHFKGHYLLNCR